MKLYMFSGVLLLCLLQGCSTAPYHFTPVSELQNAVHVDPARVKVYDAEPALRYELIGIIRCRYAAPKDEESLMKTVRQLQEIASNHGADALIVRRVNFSQGETMVIKAKAVKILIEG